MNINNNTDDMQNGCFTSRFDNNPKLAKNFLDCIEYLIKRTDGTLDEIWALYDNNTIEERTSKIKKGLKRAKAKEATFKPDEESGLIKPANNVYNYFRKIYKAKEGKSYTREGFENAYKALKKTELTKLRKELDKLNDEYQKEYDNLKNIAIYNGEHPPPKIGGACTTYALFMKDCYSDDPQFLGKKQVKEFNKLREDCKKNDKPHTENHKEICGLIKSYWDGLSDIELNTIKELAAEDKLRYKCENYERSVFELEAKIRFTENNTEYGEQEKKRILKNTQEELTTLLDTGKPENYNQYRGSHPATPKPYENPV